MKRFAKSRLNHSVSTQSLHVTATSQIQWIPNSPWHRTTSSISAINYSMFRFQHSGNTLSLPMPFNGHSSLFTWTFLLYLGSYLFCVFVLSGAIVGDDRRTQRVENAFRQVSVAQLWLQGAMTLSIHGFAVFSSCSSLFSQSPSSKPRSSIMDLIPLICRSLFLFFLAVNSATHFYVILPLLFVQYGHTTSTLYFLGLVSLMK